MFEAYDGKSNPIAHITAYTRKMALWADRDALMCKMFPTNLGYTVVKWFHQLPENSISSWNQLASRFVFIFISNTREHITIDMLLSTRHREGKSLGDFTSRYLNVYTDIEECEEKTAVATFCLVLPKVSRLRKSLTLQPAKRMNDLQERINKYIKLEEDNKTTDESIIDKESPKGLKSIYKAIYTSFNELITKIFQEIKDKHYFRWSTRMIGDLAKRDQTRSCANINDKEHSKKECINLKWHLEHLVGQEHPKEFINRR
ncbi:uncharacterized protein LOC119985499 [Tripterygium wilfordii]|uniref:uncharacterized protein LOC119985499 n=1 Tax=Tripterygium wilfordii TaxID=458696 RepID=UPI0018F83C25|nr:uncharacterized protein LOC119985499 [Tripterygium wilfordii]